MAVDRPPDEAGRRARDADDAVLDARLRRLGERLGALSPKRDERKAESARPAGSSTNLARAMRLSSEFVAGILVGGFLGWLFDRLTGWSPWGLIVFLLLGFAAGTLNALRSAGLMARQSQKN